MVAPVVIINLFFVPALPLYLIYKSCRKPLTPGCEVLFQYAIAVSLNHVAAHVLSFLQHKLTWTGFALDSARYTVVALLAGLLLWAAWGALRALGPAVSVSRIGADEVKADAQDEA